MQREFKNYGQLLVLLVALSLGQGVCAAGDDHVAEPEQERFQLADHNAFILAPDEAVQVNGAKPWVWYAPTLGKSLPGTSEDWMFERLHAKGISIAGIDVGESYGSPAGRAVFQKLYEHMVANGYSKKPVLLARSRGGLMLYNWAVEHPEAVGGVAAIYPVCNLTSYPGLKTAAPAYGMTVEELKANLAEHNPVDRLAPLAKAKVPIYHMHGDSDRIVPIEPNTGLLAERYKALGGSVQVELIKGGGHDVKRHWFESQAMTGFMIEHALADTRSKNPDPGE